MSDLYTLLNEQAEDASRLFVAYREKGAQDRPDAEFYRTSARYHRRRFTAAMDALELLDTSDTPYTAMRAAALFALRQVSDLMTDSEAATQLDELYGNRILSLADRAQILAEYHEISRHARQLPAAYQWDGDR